MKGAAEWCANSMLYLIRRGHSHFDANAIAHLALKSRIEEITVDLRTGSTDPPVFLSLDSFRACVEFHRDWLPELFREKNIPVSDVSSAIVQITPDWDYLADPRWSSFRDLPMRCKVVFEDSNGTTYISSRNMYGELEVD